MSRLTKVGKPRLPQRQLELGLKMRVADLQFFKVFSAAIVHHGLIAKLGASSFAILMSMKAQSRPSDGRIYVGLDELSEQTGLHRNTVRACLRKLILLGYIEHKTEPAGKKLHYYVFDEFHFRRLYEGEGETDALDKLHAGESDGTIRLPYRPSQNREDISQIAAFMHGGPKPDVAQLVVADRPVVVVAESGANVQVVVNQGGEFSQRVEQLRRRQQSATHDDDDVH